MYSLSTVPVLPAIRDSVGVTLIDHDSTALRRAPALVLDTVPLAVIGAPGTDPDYDLTYVRSLWMLSDGRFIGLDAIHARVLVFKVDGSPGRIIGRSGEGPGEFQRPQAILAAGDTLLVVDDRNARMSWITADGGVVRQQRFTADSLRFCRSPVDVVQMQWLVNRNGCASAGAIPPRQLMAIGVSDLTGQSRRDLLMIPAAALVAVETRYGGHIARDVMRLRLAAVPGVVRWDTLIATAANSSQVVVARYNLDGKLVSRLVMPVHRRAVTSAMRNAVIDSSLAQVASHGERMIDPVESRRLARVVPFADSLPPHGALFVSPDQTLWVLDAFALSDTTWGATAFRGDGGIIGHMSAPGYAVPVWFGNDRVILRTEDADGVVTMKVYRIRAIPKNH